MKKSVLFTLLFAILLGFSPQTAIAAIAKNNLPETVTASQHSSRPVTSARSDAKNQRHAKKMDRKNKRLKKLLEKLTTKPAQGNARQYLTLCLILLLATIVFFAIGGTILNIVGGVTSIAAAIFFVLWLLEYIGTM